MAVQCAACVFDSLSLTGHCEVILEVRFSASVLWLNNTTYSESVAVIADRTAYDERYSFRLLSGTTVNNMSIYLFTVSH